MIDLVISDRLTKIAGLVSKNKTVADIGTDHGYLPIYMVKNKMAEEVIACDMRKKPLEKARQNAKEMGVLHKIDFRISDGLDALAPGEADSIIICGMGGFAIKKILDRALNEGKMPVGTDCVLSPHTDRESLSRFLFEKGFKIEEEYLLHEKAAYYILWKCTYDGIERKASASVHAYGDGLIKKRDEALKSYLIREEELLLRVLEKLEFLPPEKVSERIGEVKERLRLNYSVRWF